MELTVGQLNRATLARQMLLRRESIGVVDAMGRVVALQAQEPASPYVALWNRIDRFDPAELDAAFREQAVLKATLMRMTLHAVTASDHPRFHDAIRASLRAARVTDARFRGAGVDPAELEALLPELLGYLDRPRSNAELDAWIDGRLGPPSRAGAWLALRTFGPFVHAPTGGPWSFGSRPAYLAAPSREVVADPDGSLRHLAMRYLAGFGPATVADLARFALVPRTRARLALEQLGDALVRHTGPGAATMFDIPGAPLPSDDVAAPPRLLPMWDSLLLAFDDRSRVIPPEYRRHIIRVNGDVLPSVLVDGSVAGVWRPTDDGIEVSAFHRLSAASWDSIVAEARDLATFLEGRDPRTYGRYGHWWTAIPGDGRQVIPWPGTVPP